jgi:trans-2,3-dihydro-3-hydroxyanthranilate isomerase
MPALSFRLVDVFAAEPLSGNGLTVIITPGPLDAELMQRLTQELRQFETIFLTPAGEEGRFRARVFTMEEELDFAGHPVVGAAAVLHEAYAPDRAQASWTIVLNLQEVTVESRWSGDHATAVTRQPSAELIGTVAASEEAEWLRAAGLTASDRDPALPIEVMTTGLSYLIIPVTASGLERVRIGIPGFEARLGQIGAKFAYFLDARNREGRTWDNHGQVEDIATGSAAGPVAAYLVRHGLAKAGLEIILRQGRFIGRPSEMRLRVESDGVFLSGEVRMVARGEFDSSISAGPPNPAANR